MHGPLHGSEDCLGMTEGISYDAETKTIIYHDVESGEFEGSWPYMVQKLKWAFNSAGNEYLAYEHIRELSGLSGLEFPEPSTTAAKQMYEAAKGHLVSKLPGVYMDAETTTRYTDLYTVLNDHLTTEFAKFVVGQRSLDELPKFFEELKAMGLDEYVQMVNDAYTDFEWDGVIK